MKNPASVIGGLILLGVMVAPTDAGAQQFPGTSSVLSSPATKTLMMTLGYAPNDYCGFYFFLSTKNTGQFSDQLLRALLPMCFPVAPQPVIPPQSGGSDPGGTGSVGGSTGGGEEGGGEEGGGEEGGSDGSGSTGGGQGDAGWPGSGGGSTGGGEGGGDPFGGGGAMATPEPVSLILLGTGLLGVGGFGAARRRRNDLED